MEATSTSETPVNFYQTTQYSPPEDRDITGFSTVKLTSKYIYKRSLHKLKMLSVPLTKLIIDAGAKIIHLVLCCIHNILKNYGWLYSRLFHKIYIKSDDYLVKWSEKLAAVSELEITEGGKLRTVWKYDPSNNWERLRTHHKTPVKIISAHANFETRNLQKTS